ncbi:MAG: arginase family protein, partial [Deltaproteobacteria bacterium]|nr:arginase family protein [Deltaproteobacteria bacterium]
MSNLNIKKKKLAAEEITVLGVPFDSNSSFLRGAALAPLRIREALFSESTNMWTEKSIDLG